jgi:hypothetical protein
MANPTYRYVFVLFASLLGFFGLLECWALPGRDHFAAIASNQGSTWYQDLGGDAVTEIQDQDLFFHNIGTSIDHLRKADVVIVGSSLVAFALNGKVAKAEMDNKYGLSFYNLSFVGISSGEFTRRTAEKYKIHPKLWIINADDGGGGGNFFGTGLQRSFAGDVKTIAAVQHGRIIALKEVARRNLRWRVEALFKFVFQSSALERADRTAIPHFFRDAVTGDTDMGAFPRYDRQDNPPADIKRSSDCHTTEDVIRTAKVLAKTFGGEIVLTLIPNTYYCEQQAREVANALGIELVLTGKLNYSSWDGGGHLDRLGSTEFTTDLFTALEKTATFRRVLNLDQDIR